MKEAIESTRRTALALAIAACTASLASELMAQQEIGYVESFALASDREEALKQLIPGTEEYYYYHALHYQNTRQVPALGDILEQWEKRLPGSGQRKQILYREALINYPNDAKGSREFILRELGLQFNHQQEGQARAQDHPYKLSQEKVAWSRFLADALQGTETLNRINPGEFYTLLANGHELTDPQRRDFLQRAQLPDLPGLVGIVTADLNSKESRGFGEFNIHRALTSAQLDELRNQKPDLLSSQEYVHTYLAKLRPGADSNPAANPKVREAYLARAWAFVQDLDPVLNSLKAHLLYQRLVHDHSQGIHDPDRLLAYVKLPRNVNYIRPEWREDQRALWQSPADLQSNFAPVTGLLPIGDDEPLVREYLLHFLKDAEDYELYAPFLAEAWLKAVFAEAKIVNGVGDPERWASLLSPSAFQALKDRVDIEFDPTSVEHFGVTDPVKLRVHIKNVETLLVKVFEVNTLNYYLEKGTEISTDLDLDGLVTNFERTVEYKEPPQLRLAREFTFPEIENRRGVWVIEFIGGSKSSRAVIRKGKLEILTATAGAGEVVTVLDESHKPVPDAAVWFGGRRLECDEQGRVLIPFSNDPGSRTTVVEAGDGFAALARFQHGSENYQLTAGIQVDRESLRPNSTATLALRPTLTVGGQPISLSLLSEVRLILTSTDLDGVSSTATISDFKLASDREATHEFRVPDRLASLNVQLVAKVKVASQGGQETELSDAKSFEINAQLRTERVDDLYLSRIEGDYVLELLGRTGEARAGQNVNLTVHRSGFQNTRHLTLKTDQLGGIELGALDGIAEVTAEAPGGHQRSWQLPEARRTHPGKIHATRGETIRVPYFGALDRSQVAFFAVSSGHVTADAYPQLALEDGFLVAKGLDAGDYELHFKESGQSITLQVADGTVSVHHVFNEARTLELRERAPAHLAGLKVEGESLQIEVANADPLTRVHVIATRFLPDFDVFGALGLAPRRGLLSGQPSRLPNLYVSGRKIGDEFRYILERRYTQKFPGNMLERPEILLNPWAVRDTEAEEEELAEGQAYDRSGTGAAGGAAREAAARQPGGEAADGRGQSIDFLATDPAELFNLQPGPDGKITLKLEALGDRQHVHVLVVDPDGASYQELSLPDRKTGIRDLRLVNALDPARHFTEQDSVTLLKAGEQLQIPDLLTAQFEVFENLSSAYRYLLAMREDATLREFSFVLDWPSLKEAEKRKHYSKYACHELSFFLAMKDPEFFKTVVVPYLANKRDRTFLDQYLLDAQLGEFLAPYEYERLNVPERILLARRLPGRIQGVRLDLRDRLSLRPPDLAAEEYWFSGALAAGGLTVTATRAAIDGIQADFETANFAAPSQDAAAGPAAARVAGKALSQNLARKRGGVSKAEQSDLEGESRNRLSELRAKVAQTNNLREELGQQWGKASEVAEFDVYLDEFEPASLGEGFYRAVETTKEWAENNYYHLPIASHTFSLIPESKFWLDFAEHEGETGFGSRHLGQAARNAHEMLLALAVIDLPFKAPESKSEINEASLTFTAAGNAIAFHREIKEAGMAEKRPPLLVSQSYFRHDDRYRIENGEKVDKFVTDEFVAGLVYGTQVVVTNPTSSRQKLDVLIQIPKGSLQVLGHRATATERVAMEPYTTQRFERSFYFPASGQFPVYPAHVSKAGQVVAHADNFELKVVDEPSKVDETSWAHLSQWGTEEQVLAYLAEQNLHAIDLTQIAWRFRESADFFKKALAVLDLRGIYNGTLFSYGLYHDHVPAIRQFLLVDGRFLNLCGQSLKSELITIDPINRRTYEHLEYKPLVNSRAHTVGGSPKILNGRIRGQYQSFLRLLTQKAELSPSDQLSTACYLFLQDRAGEAMERLEAVNPQSLPTGIQYDYFQAYAAFYRADPDQARGIALKYANHPVDRWRERFAAVVAQADEIQGKAPQIVEEGNRDQQQAATAATEPSLELEVKGSSVILNYERVSNVLVNYYEMDLEFLFSTNPFVSSEGGSFSIVRPNRSERLQLGDDKRQHTFELPRDYQSKNVLVEVIGGGKKRSLAVYSNELQTAVSERYGILTVRHSKDGRPLPTTYVKVYALTGAGPVFYKDGYTDLRGKFDYASVSTSDIADASKFSILAMSAGHGATVLEAPVPQR